MVQVLGQCIGSPSGYNNNIIFIIIIIVRADLFGIRLKVNVYYFFQFLLIMSESLSSVSKTWFNLENHFWKTTGPIHASHA